MRFTFNLTSFETRLPRLTNKKRPDHWSYELFKILNADENVKEIG